MKFVSLALASFLLLVGADAHLLRRAETNEVEEEEEELNILAKVDLPDNSVVKFFEPEDGLVVFTSETSGMGEKMLEVALGGAQDEAKSLQMITPVELFEKLSTDVAPKGLLDAQERMIAKIAEVAATPPEEGEIEDDEEEDDDADVDEGSAMSKSGWSTCSWWQSYQCPYYHGYKGTCYSCYSGTKKTVKYTRDMYLKAYAYSGKIKHRLRYKPCNSCSWKTLTTHNVKKGKFSRIGPWTSHSKVKFEGKIYQAHGDVWHWYVSWL